MLFYILFFVKRTTLWRGQALKSVQVNWFYWKIVFFSRLHLFTKRKGHWYRFQDENSRPASFLDISLAYFPIYRVCQRKSAILKCMIGAGKSVLKLFWRFWYCVYGFSTFRQCFFIQKLLICSILKLPIHIQYVSFEYKKCLKAIWKTL